MTGGRRRRVLHIGKFYPPHMGGIETHVQALCEALGPDVEPHVVVASDSRRTVREVVRGVPVTRAAGWLGATAPLCPSMIGAVARARADLVHLHWPNPMGLVAALAVPRTVPLVVTYHSDVVKQRIGARVFTPLLTRALRRSAAIVATSPNYVASSPVLQRYRDRCQVIPYGIATARFASAPAQEVARIREAYGPRLLLTVGRLTYYKGFEHLLEAMRHVAGRLLLVGDGPLRERLVQLARSLGVADRVVFLGEIQNDALVPYYHAADVFVLPSIARSEAFGIVQIEAMASATPVVNTALDSGVPYVSLDGETGLTVRPADPRALAAALTTLLDDAALRDRYGAAGRRRATAEFSLETMVERTRALYRAVMTGT